MWSCKQSVCSAVSGASKCDDQDGPCARQHIYPFAITLRVRVLQIVCGIGGLVVGAIGWLEERQKPALGLGVPAGAVTVLAAATSVYFSRGFGGWVSARSRSTNSWGPPWRALGPSPCAAIPLTILWTIVIAAHITMLVFWLRSLMNISCGSRTCMGVAAAQLSRSTSTLAAALFLLQMDLRYDPAVSPPRQCDANTCTGAMWSRKQSVCSAVSGASKCDDQDGPCAGQHIYPFAITLRVRVLQIVCGIGGLVVGAVGWLEERQKPILGLGVPAGTVTVLAAATSVYFSRGSGGWVSARSRSTNSWGAPWRALGPSPCAAISLTILWTIAIAAHITMLVFCLRSLMNISCGSRTCMGVAAAQLSISTSTLAAALFMLQMDLRYDPSVSPPRQCDANTCTGVSMVPLTSVAINSGNSGEEVSPLSKERGQHPHPPT